MSQFDTYILLINVLVIKMLNLVLHWGWKWIHLNAVLVTQCTGQWWQN